ncbi:hypothetical protein SCHPADRAFT_943855 [Schizopora paradoxa]|uniref:RNI-like protein n=1 Tax=Schizopora paradoxa TaxID=27342 RepID=A0A0H2RI86_9AGAM|nr:hypothetical protein SCHPADRAFT_943855 [Schizopora paradoxa]
MLMGNGSSVPSEIWDRIFMHCERVIETNAIKPEFFPNYHLHPLLLACRGLHAIAERRLYTSVWLGSNKVVKDRGGNKKVVLAGKDACQRFYETVQSNHRLASLVRDLHLGTTELFFEETRLHIQLIKICKSVEALDLRGCTYGAEDQLKIALAGMNLSSFKLSVRALRYNYQGAEVFSIPQLLNFIQNWPCLEILDVYLGEDWGVIREDKLVDAAFVSGKCATLRDVLITGNHISPKDLVCLRAIAPALQKLKIMARMDCISELRRCLDFWSSTLRDLDVWVGYDGITRSRASNSIFKSPMVELRSLNISTAMAPPLSLAYLPKLEVLSYEGEYADGMELARIIEDDKLPCLREIGVTFTAPLDENESRPPSRSSQDPPDEMHIEVLQELHKVCGQKHIVLNAAWTLEELEQFVVERYPEPLADGSREQEMPLNSDNDGDSDKEDGWEDGSGSCNSTLPGYSSRIFFDFKIIQNIPLILPHFAYAVFVHIVAFYSEPAGALELDPERKPRSSHTQGSVIFP